MTKKIEEYSEVELKSLAYDCLVQIEMSQNNLKIINQALGKLKDEEPREKKK